LRKFKDQLNLLTVIFVVLVGVAIFVGKFIPFELANYLPQPRNAQVEQTLTERVTKVRTALQVKDPQVSTQSSDVQAEVLQLMRDGNAKKAWNVLLLIYCLIAGLVPVWLLLQPRGHLGGYFLYFALGAGALGLIFGGLSAKYPAITEWKPNASGAYPPLLFPMLFITVACGACSGFHSLIASGTTSKQLNCESDAKVVGYGSMLLEGMVAVVSLCCVMMFAQDDPALKGSPNQIYAAGIGAFAGVIGVSKSFGMAFALMAFTTFVYDTLDVCTRLGRFIIQELTGMHNIFGRWIGTALTAGVPLFFLLGQPLDAEKPIWAVFWSLFGASNQLLAALTLLGITVWLWRTQRAFWVWPIVGLPALFMYIMSTWALTDMTRKSLFTPDGALVNALQTPIPYIGLVLLGLAIIMLLEAIRILIFADNHSDLPPKPLIAPAS
jgi:carbon starvation protein